jgi:phospholipase/carboxylesterase
MAPAGRRGSPRVFVSHGTRDGVLPIDLCSRKIVPELKRADYDVHYREFDGGHTIPATIALEAVRRFAQHNLH